jgi:hypothetical protein
MAKHGVLPSLAIEKSGPAYTLSTTVSVPSLELGPPSRKRVCAPPPPPPNQRGGGEVHTTHWPACEAVEDSRFGRLERKLSTLLTLWWSVKLPLNVPVLTVWAGAAQLRDSGYSSSCCCYISTCILYTTDRHHENHVSQAKRGLNSKIGPSAPPPCPFSFERKICGIKVTVTVIVTVTV